MYRQPEDIHCLGDSPKQVPFTRGRQNTHVSHGSHATMTNSSEYPSLAPRSINRRFTGHSQLTLGSLRPGQSTIKLSSSKYIGLAVHVTLCGFAFYFFSYGYGRLLAEYLKANDERQVQAAHYVLVWPQALSLIIGLISDCFPLRGYRRKSYMVLGWVISLVMYLVIIVMDTYADSGRALYKSEAKSLYDSSVTNRRGGKVSRYPIPFLFVSLFAAFGIQMSWLAAISLSVEFAQREPLMTRGRLQATLVTLYYAGGVIANSLTAAVISEGVNTDHLVSTLSVGGSALVLAVVSAIAIPFVLMCYHEDPFVAPTRAGLGMSVRQRIKDFWKFCHQSVVYRVLFFISAHLFLVGLFNSNVRQAVSRWSGITQKEALYVEVCRMVAMMLSIWFWKHFMTNVGWRPLAGWGSLAYIVVYFMLTVLTTFDYVRSEWFYGAMLTIGDVLRAWLILYAITLATEVADVGREGVTLALGMSFQTLSGLAGYTLAAIFPGLTGTKVTMEEVKIDAAATRMKVFTGFMICIGINFLSFPLIYLLPRQKADAQQIRAFGGYNRYASTALLVLFAALLCFNFAINLVVTM